MVRGLNLKLLKTTNPLLLPSNNPVPISTTAHLFTNSPPKVLPHSLQLSSFPCQYQLFDEISQRDFFVFGTLNLLKRAPVNLDLVTSIHCLSLKTGARSHISAHTSLLTAYARAGDFDASLSLFDETAARDVISWNAIINASILNCNFQTSLVLFQEMVNGFGEFDSRTLVIVLSALSRTHDLKNGMILHGMAIKRRFDWDIYLCNVLIDMYAKCSDLNSSKSVFERMEVKDTASWNSMINGCFYNGFPEKSVFYFREMCISNVQADQVSLSCVISACSYFEELSSFGESVHGLVIRLGYEGIPHSSVSNSLILFYSRCGEVEAAEEVFRRLIHKNMVSWNSMICGLVENKRVDDALHLFHMMQSSLVTQPDAVALITILPLCGEFSLLLQGKSIHGFTIRQELDTLDSSIANSLLDMYCKCDNFRAANFLFEAMPNRDLISWNTIISGYSHSDLLKTEAHILFCELLQTGLKCSLASVLAIFPSCTCREDLYFGKSVHCWKIKCGFANNVSAISALMHMYINCGDLIASSLLLKSIVEVSDVVSWNTVIVGCVQNGYYKDALETFRFMLCCSHVNPDPVTMVSVLSACGNLELVFNGRTIHGLVLKSFMGLDLQVRNALLTMYFRCGDANSAESVFRSDGARNLCSWNCMISGFAQNKEGVRALEFFRCMESFQPNEFSLVGILCACTQLGNLRHGQEINGYVFRFELQNNVFISSALVDMYSKCGELDIALRVFENSAEKSVASWNSMISAYGFHGHGRRAIEVFSEMSESGFKATKSTFIALLMACSHSGLVDEGWKHYNRMSEEFGIEPTTEHHVCMVDMLGRAGRLSEAFEFIKTMPTKPAPGVLGALLSACNDCADLEMGKSIAGHLFCLEPQNAGYYVTLSNLYARFGMWNDAVDIRSMIQDRGMMKPPGCSSIDVVISRGPSCCI